MTDAPDKLVFISPNGRTTQRASDKARTLLQQQLGPGFRPIVVPPGFSLAGFDHGAIVSAGRSAKARAATKKTT